MAWKLRGSMKLSKKNWLFSRDRMSPRASTTNEGPTGHPKRFNIWIILWKTIDCFQICWPKMLVNTQVIHEIHVPNEKYKRGLHWNLALVIFWERIELDHFSFHNRSKHYNDSILLSADQIVIDEQKNSNWFQKYCNIISSLGYCIYRTKIKCDF